MERVGVGCIVITALLVCANAKPAPNNAAETAFQPGLAMHCGKATQYRDSDTGEWISDPAGKDCMKNNEDILAYCKKVYPTLQITNIVEDTEKTHVPTWCAAGSSPPCHGHGHNVTPMKCIVGEYQTKALEVPKRCTFEHTHDFKVCKSPDAWEMEAGKICHAKSQTVSQPQMLEACHGLDLWQGVQFLCCISPSLPKPKPNKGKAKAILPPQPPAKIDVIDADVNPICMQPKKVGLCRALLPAWHYNKDTQECQFFHYGGCGGNDNKFGSQTDCENTCFPSKAAKRQGQQDNSICGLPKDPGPCRAFFPKWYFDPSVGECLDFVYGGCNGNDNQFQMKEDCEALCEGYKGTGSEKPPINLLTGGSILPLGPGPVLLEEGPAEMGDKSTTTTVPATTAETYYSDKTTLDNEHDVFLKKLGDLKAEHKAKVTQVLGKWDDDSERIKTSSDKDDHERLENDLQDTVSNLEDEYDDKMDKLNEFHKGRMDKMFGDERTKMFQKLVNQLSTDTPKMRHIVNALKKYVEVEKQDKSHTLQHYYMALYDEFDEDSIPDFVSHLSDIDARINSTWDKLNQHPDILEQIREEVDDLFAGIPPSPNYDDEDEEEADDEILDLIEEENPVIDASLSPPIKIDDGGLPDPDICELPPYVGPCRASLLSYYYNPATSRCEVFYYGGCNGNANNFASMEGCQAACPDGQASFDLNGVLVEEEVDDDDEDGYYDGEEEDDDDLTVDDNSIEAAMEDGEEDAEEDETKLDVAIDEMFDIDGNPKDKFDVILNDPEPMYAGARASTGKGVKSAEVNATQLVWIGVAAGVLLIIAIVAVILYKRRPTTLPPRVVVDKADTDEKEMSPEEKQLLQLQQNGYENPTYKFFERQARA